MIAVYSDDESELVITYEEHGERLLAIERLGIAYPLSSSIPAIPWREAKCYCSIRKGYVGVRKQKLLGGRREEMVKR